MYLGGHILTLIFPVRLNGLQRLIGLVPPEFSDRQDLTFEDIRHQVEPLLDLKVTEVNSHPSCMVQGQGDRWQE
jgi:hypothetical protein